MWSLFSYASCRAPSRRVARVGALSLLSILASRPRHRSLLGATSFRLQQKPRHKSLVEGRCSRAVLVSRLVSFRGVALFVLRLVVARGRLSISPLLACIGVVLLAPGVAGTRSIRIGVGVNSLCSRALN